MTVLLGGGVPGKAWVAAAECWLLRQLQRPASASGASVIVVVGRGTGGQMNIGRIVK